MSAHWEKISSRRKRVCLIYMRSKSKKRTVWNIAKFRIHSGMQFSRPLWKTKKGVIRWVTIRCRLSWLTNSALVHIWAPIRGREGCGVSANEYSCAHGTHCTQYSTKLLTTGTFCILPLYWWWNPLTESEPLVPATLKHCPHPPPPPPQHHTYFRPKFLLYCYPKEECTVPLRSSTYVIDVCYIIDECYHEHSGDLNSRLGVRRSDHIAS
jgi:hypothetical protein